jgi:hypothetical protein
MLRVAVAGTFAARLEQPLRRHLRHVIAGAALDVWYRYPNMPGPTAPATRPFTNCPIY